MNRTLTLAGFAMALLTLSACRATQISNVSKDPTYDSSVMKRVFVVAVVKVDRNQKMLEDEFVRQLSARGRDAIASHTVVPHGTKLESEAWKSLITANGWDTVIVSRLVDMDVSEKEMGAKLIPSGHPGESYGYYGSAYTSVYQPSSYVREQTAYVETKVFDVASSKEVWSARSKTIIQWGGDPVPQIRKFVKQLFYEARR